MTSLTMREALAELLFPHLQKWIKDNPHWLKGAVLSRPQSLTYRIDIDGRVFTVKVSEVAYSTRTQEVYK